MTPEALFDEEGNELETVNHAMMRFSFRSKTEFPSGSVIRHQVNTQ